MDLRLLNYFLVLSEELHYTKAAERLGIAQPTLSQQIRILENNLNCRLFQRQGRSIVLTTAGETLVVASKRVFKEVSSLEEMMELHHQRDRRQLIINVSGSHLVKPFIRRLSEFCLDVAVLTNEKSTQETLKMINNHTCDLGIVFLDHHINGMTHYQLFKEKIYLVCHKDSPIHSFEDVIQGKHRDETLILLTNMYYIQRVVKEIYNSNNILLDVNYSVDNYPACLDILQENGGYSYLPYSYIKLQNITNLKLIEVNHPLSSQQISLVHRDDLVIDPVMQQCITLIKNTLNMEII